MQNAGLKEWAIIYDALLRGDQIVDLRKGGIREEERHFVVRAERFWLYPSYEHQRAELLKPAARESLARVNDQAPAEGALRFDGWADIVATGELRETSQLAALDDHFIWTREYAEQRLSWKPKHPLLLMVLRVHRLRAPVVARFDESYRGCGSWVELLDLPADPSQLPSQPALSDAQFDARWRAIREALPDVSFDRLELSPIS